MSNWHVYHDHNIDTDLYAAAVLGPTDLEADDLSASGEVLVRDHEFPISDMGLTLRYVATFDHEPSDAEKDELAPEGHRTDDADEENAA